MSAPVMLVAAVLASLFLAGTTKAQTAATDAPATAASVPAACLDALTGLRGQLTQAPADRQPRLSKLLDDQQTACEALRDGQSRMGDAQWAVAQAQIDLSLVRLTSAVNDSAGGRAISLAGAAQAIREALGSIQASSAEPRRVVVTWTAGATAAMALDAYVLPQSVFYGAALLRRERLRDLLTRLRFPNPVGAGLSSERQLPAGGQFLVWLVTPQGPEAMVEQLRDSSRRATLKTRTIDVGAPAPIELQFGPDDLATNDTEGR